MSLSNFSENLLLDWLLTAGAATRPTTWFLALHTGDPGETGANEIAATAYARQAIAMGAAASGASISTDSQAFTTTDVGEITINYVTIWDDDGTPAGNCLFSGAMTVPRQFSQAKPLTFAAGDIVCALD